MKAAAVLGCLLALAVLADGYREGGSAGPCAPGTRFVAHNSGARFHAERQTFPPGRRCVAVDRYGGVLSMSFPTLGDYGLALVAFLVPLALLDAWRRRRVAWQGLRDRALFHQPAFAPVLFVGCCLGFIAWAGTFFPAGRGGPCDLSRPTGTFSCVQERRLIPPSVHYEFQSKDREVLGSGTVPRPYQYLVATGWFLLPFAAWGYGRRARRWRDRVTGGASRSPA